MDPPDHALVLCLDEKCHIQSLDRTAPLLPLRPGLPERQIHDYEGHGTTTLFDAFNILTSKVIGQCLSHHRGCQFVKSLSQVEKEAPPELDAHLMMDNDSTPWSSPVHRWMSPRNRPRFHFRFTPR